MKNSFKGLKEITVSEIIIFLLAFVTFASGIYGLSLFLEHRQNNFDHKQNQIILENVRDRFKLFLKMPISVGTIGAEHFTNNNLKTGDYGPLNEKLLNSQHEILGLNLINEKGEIVRGYPKENNKKALGHITQNFEAITKSFNNKEPYWFSPPFKLFQGLPGFALYFPIVNKGELKGWFATVLSTELFVKDFKLQQFLNTYELVIKDQETDKAYFATGIESETNAKRCETSAFIDGRNLVFVSWRKNQDDMIFIPFWWIIATALILAILSLGLFKAYEQRKKIHRQLEDVSVLLKMTSLEAFGKLIDLQNEFYKLGSTDTIHYITHLLEQIDLLQTTANTGREIEMEEVPLLPTLKTEISSLGELIQKKSIKVNFPKEKFENVIVSINPWLFKHSVLSNILTHSILQGESGTGISVEYQKLKNAHSVSFHTQRIFHTDSQGNILNLNRRMTVAKKVLNIFGGDLFLDQDLAGGMIIRIELPFI